MYFGHISSSISRMVRNLYYPLDHLQQDAVTALASSHTDHFLSPIMHEWSQPPPPLVQGLVKPYHVTERGPCQHEIESALSRIVMTVLMKLQISKLRHLTVSRTSYNNLFLDSLSFFYLA